MDDFRLQIGNTGGRMQSCKAEEIYVNTYLFELDLLKEEAKW
jgi:hypothetical protein